MRIQILVFLLELAKMGADRDYVRVSSRELGSSLGKSQQTASRLLLQMGEEGLVWREREGRHQKVKITPSGIAHLRNLHEELARIFEGSIIEGRLFTGVGEGSYYMSQEGYRSQFREKLGFEPYPGTLNLRVPSCSVQEISMRPGIKIEGFRDGDRSFGGGRCYPIRIGPNDNCAIFLPDRTHYPPDVLEIVSSSQLRSEMGVTDGDVVCLEVLPG